MGYLEAEHDLIWQEGRRRPVETSQYFVLENDEDDGLPVQYEEGEDDDWKFEIGIMRFQWIFEAVEQQIDVVVGGVR